MGAVEQVRLARRRRGWTVVVRLAGGEVRRFRYGTEAQARYFAAVFRLGPRTLPVPGSEGGSRFGGFADVLHAA